MAFNFRNDSRFDRSSRQQFEQKPEPRPAQSERESEGSSRRVSKKVPRLSRDDVSEARMRPLREASRRVSEKANPPRRQSSVHEATQNAMNPRNWRIGDTETGRDNASEEDLVRQARRQPVDFWNPDAQVPRDAAEAQQSLIMMAIQRALQGPADDFRGGPSYWSPEPVWRGPGPEDYNYYDVSPITHAARAAASLRRGEDVVAPHPDEAGEVYYQPLTARDYDMMSGWSFAGSDLARQRVDDSWDRARQRRMNPPSSQGRDYSGYDIPF